MLALKRSYELFKPILLCFREKLEILIVQVTCPKPSLLVRGTAIAKHTSKLLGLFTIFPIPIFPHLI